MAGEYGGEMIEEEVKLSLIKYLKSLGLEEIVDETCVHGNRLCDIVYIDKKRKFICIEVKLTDWKKVLSQAKKHRGYADLIYIAMPVPRTYKKKKNIEDICIVENIGLFWLKESGDIWLKAYTPKEQNQQLTYYARHLEQSIYSILHFTFLAKCIEYPDMRKKNIQRIFNQRDQRPITKRIILREF